MTATELSSQIIVEVHLLIPPGRMGAVIEELGTRLERTRDNAVEPLYFSYDIEDLELRICFLVSNSWLFDQYIVTVLRSVAGVQASRVRLTLNGRVFEEGISSLISDEGKPLSAHVFLHNGPEYDDAVWEREVS